MDPNLIMQQGALGMMPIQNVGNGVPNMNGEGNNEQQHDGTK